MQINRYNKIRNILLILITIIFVALFLYSFSHIILWNINNKRNSTLNKQIKKYVITNKRSNSNKKEIYSIDFDGLKKENNDVVAYLNVKNTNIDYVVVKSYDNNYYLNHNFEKKYNVSGWVFVDYKNIIDGTDKNIVIYGHNTRNGSMFGTLKNTLKSEWYKDNNNRKIILVTEKMEYIYEVFSIYEIDKEDYYIKTEFESNEKYLEFLNTINKRSIYNFNTELNSEDRILTLSTCVPGGLRRVVLHAKLIQK